MRVSEVPDLDIDHVEIGFEDRPRTEEFLELCNKRGWGYSVHIPCPKHSKERVRHFSPATSDQNFFKESLEVTLETLEYWAGSQATHVVMHFPNANSIDRSQNLVLDLQAATTFLDTVTAAADAAGLMIAVENLSTNPKFWSAQHYIDALGDYDNVSFCLDVGHAFQAAGLDALFAFTHLLGQRLMSCHLYDYRLDDPNYYHECFATPDKTFFCTPLDQIMTRLIAANQNLILIHEAGDASSSEGIRSLERSLNFLKECAT